MPIARALSFASVRTCRTAWGVLVCTLFILAGCEGPKHDLRIATNLWVGYQPLFLARERGFIDAQQFRLVEFGTSRESLRAFRNGEVELAALTLDEVLRLRAESHDVRVLLVMDYSEGADALLVPGLLQSVAEIKGRRVGVEPGAVGSYLLRRALHKAGLKPADIQVVPVEAPDHPSAFSNNKVDALVTYEPMKSQLLGQGARQLFSSEDIPGEIVDVLAVRGSVADSRARDLQLLINGWFMALQDQRKQPLEAARLMAPRIGMTDEQWVAASAELHFPDQPENCKHIRGGDHSALNGVAMRMAAVMLEDKLINQSPSLNGLIVADAEKLLGCIK